ncbi:Phospholipid/glycerol acyltransferase domain-containing protein [Aphelenchoides besseyi]|nr:Phospholipid/glycerol acyltransferase domain-containing protein [Aphelenchoides besseyi]
MLSLLFLWLTYFLSCVLALIIFLSLTGQSTGVREFCAKLLLYIFEWASEIRATVDPTVVADEISNVGSGGTESEEEKAQRFKRNNNPKKRLLTDNRHTLEFLSAGVEAIIEDKVTERFQAATLGNWNLLTRSRKFVPSKLVCDMESKSIVFSWKLDTVWFLGVIFRYTILLPVRFALFIIATFMLIGISLLIGSIPNEEENRPTSGIVVANHTSPIDVMVLSCDNCYAMIGQRQGGFLGFIQKAVSRCAHHIWFERTEAKDRSLVRKKLQEHVNDPNKLPILIFPEGTCINNTSVMMFKKGSFETVHPIALKYDNRLGDAFWNSSQQGYFLYLVSMMTSWALMCEVYYLPPMTREEGEDPIDFARRVKKLIAQRGGLVDLEWDGNLKRTMVPEKLKIKQKDQFYDYLSRTLPINLSDQTYHEIRKLSQGASF